MTLRSSIAAVVVLAATTMWGQSSADPLAAPRQSVAPTSNTAALAAVARAKNAAKQHLDDMNATITKMHALLKQMRAKASAAAPKDSMAKANLEMWSLMLDQLDKEYNELLAAQRAREDMDARRAAMYRQADQSAARAAQAAREAQAAQAQAGQSAGSVSGAAAAATPAAANQPSTAPAAAPSTTSSPN